MTTTVGVTKNLNRSVVCNSEDRGCYYSDYDEKKLTCEYETKFRRGRGPIS